MRTVRETLRGLLPTAIRERYHRHALKRDFGIDRSRGGRRPGSIDRRRAPGLNLIGYLDSPSGLGQSVRCLAQAARAAGVPVACLEASRSRPPAAEPAPFDVNLYHVNADGAAAIVEELGPRLHSGRANVAYWYWETESFPERWKDRFDYFDEVWVASEYCRRAIAAASPIPVTLVPPAVTSAAVSPEPKTSAGIDPSDFLFLTVLDALSVPERKNPLGTVRAFARAFPSPSNAHLLVQISNLESAPDLEESLRKAASGARVSIRAGSLPREDLENLFAACDGYVSLHRAEGFAFPIAEAMALGKPVVATDYSGSADYLDESTGFPVRWQYGTLSRRIRDYDRGTRWAEPDEGHAADQLRRVAANPAEARRRGAAGERRIAERYGLSAAGERISSALARLRERLKATA